MTFSRTSLASLAIGTTLLLAGCGGSTTTPVDSGPAPAPGTVKADPVQNLPIEKAEALKPKAEEPKVEAPKAEEPKVEAPKAEAPKVEAPKAEAPKVEAPKAEEPKADAPKLEAPKADAPKIEAPKSAALSADEKSEISKLEAKADQDLALAQATCLISGENLGSMGVPIKVSFEDKSAFLCCKGCVKSFEKDPKAALAKLND